MHSVVPDFFSVSYTLELCNPRALTQLSSICNTKHTMKAVIFTLALSASTLAASTTTTSAGVSTSSCAADYVVSQCLTDTETTQQNCNTTDYTCQCAAYQAEYK